jgi:plastocyanin
MWPRLAVAVLLALLVGSWNPGSPVVLAQVDGNDNNIAVADDCLPGDSACDPTGGCQLNRHQGDVSNAEFFALLRSPLTIPPNGSLIGHPSWRNEPSHLTVGEGKTVRVTNTGGRGHTFTAVAQFGGGFVAPLNVGLTPAPECNPNPAQNPNPPVPLPPGATDQVTDLAPGLHKFQCCIHPWMRATIRVE